MEGIKFPGQTTNATAAIDDVLLFSDTSDSGNIKDCAVSKLPVAQLSGGNQFVGNQSINGALEVNGQNWTSAWDSYTPIFIGSAGGSCTIQIFNAKFKLIGKILNIIIQAKVLSKGTCSGEVMFSVPYASSFSAGFLSGGIFPIGGNANQSRGWATTRNNTNFVFTKGSQSSTVQWADIQNSDEILVSGTYEIL